MVLSHLLCLVDSERRRARYIIRYGRLRFLRRIRLSLNPVLRKWRFVYSLIYKGPGAAEELKAAESALKCLNGTAELREIDTEWGARSLVLIKKHGTMPKKYPRRPGVAAKNPL